MLRADSGYWQGQRHRQFSLAYESMSDDFATDYTTRKDLGPDWPIC